MFKEACSGLARLPDSESKQLRAYKKVIDSLVFVEPRQIPITVVGEESVLQRSLRAQTMQGERVALASSEMLPAGSSLTFDLLILGPDLIPESLLEEWLLYGKLKGIGQWRSGSYGRYTAQIERTA